MWGLIIIGRSTIRLCFPYSHTIGGIVGGTTAVIFGVGGITSRKIRCALLLMVPSLVSKRGRAVMFSAAAAVLLSGPIATIDKNIQEVGLQ